VVKENGRQGAADVWKRGFFGWEYKGRGKDLDAAYNQLLQYRRDLEDPPLLVVSDMDIIRIYTNFNNTVPKKYEITLATLDQPGSLEILHNLFFEPEKLKPGVTIKAITEKACAQFADIAEVMRQRGLDPQAVAHFLVRVVFCLFAEDVGLLERGLFTKLVMKAGNDPKRFAHYISELFSAMGRSPSRRVSLQRGQALGPCRRHGCGPARCRRFGLEVRRQNQTPLRQRP
jgi:hypothetical protein